MAKKATKKKTVKKAVKKVSKEECIKAKNHLKTIIEENIKDISLMGTIVLAGLLVKMDRTIEQYDNQDAENLASMIRCSKKIEKMIVDHKTKTDDENISCMN